MRRPAKMEGLRHDDESPWEADSDGWQPWDTSSGGTADVFESNATSDTVVGSKMMKMRSATLEREARSWKWTKEAGFRPGSAHPKLYDTNVAPTPTSVRACCFHPTITVGINSKKASGRSREIQQTRTYRLIRRLFD